MKNFLRLLFLLAVFLLPNFAKAAYDPTTGVWLSRDPLGEGIDFTLYSYVWNNPVSLVDPFGLYGVNDMVNPAPPQGINPGTASGSSSAPVASYESPLADVLDALGFSFLGPNTNIKFGSKIQKQMAKRGWTPQSMCNTISNPSATSSALNKATGNPATAYFNSDGSYIVMDNATNEVIQISDTTNPGWIPDSSITNPPLKP